MVTLRNFLALDIGNKRVGVAISNNVAKLPSPLTTIYRSDNFINEVQKLIDENEVYGVIIGLPRSLNGNETPQTKLTRVVADQIKNQIKLPIYFIDESLSSVRAEEMLKLKKKSHKKEEIDALAACYILEDFLSTYSEAGNG